MGKKIPVSEYSKYDKCIKNEDIVSVFPAKDLERLILDIALTFKAIEATAKEECRPDLVLGAKLMKKAIIVSLGRYKDPHIKYVEEIEDGTDDTEEGQ